MFFLTILSSDVLTAGGGELQGAEALSGVTVCSGTTVHVSALGRFLATLSCLIALARGSDVSSGLLSLSGDCCCCCGGVVCASYGGVDASSALAVRTL